MKEKKKQGYKNIGKPMPMSVYLHVSLPLVDCSSVRGLYVHLK